MDILPNDKRPTCEDIFRADNVYLYEGLDGIRSRFSHFTQNELALLWGSVRTSAIIQARRWW